jgi:hypothetical protein
MVRFTTGGAGHRIACCVTVKGRISDRTLLQNSVCGENLMKAGELIRSFLLRSRSREQFSTVIARLSP